MPEEEKREEALPKEEEVKEQSLWDLLLEALKTKEKDKQKKLLEAL
jgi:hypothetical protein